MLGGLRSIYNSGFVRGVATLSSGQMVAAVIPILAAPILGRLYLPTEYGMLAAYMSIASVLSAVGNWQYAQGIIVESHDRNAEVLLRLCIVTSSITAAVAFLIAMGVILYPSASLEWQQIRPWFLALPASTFIGGMVAAWNAMANRQQRYRLMATIQIASVSLTVIASIGMGIQGYGYAGLLISYFLGQLVSFFLYGYVTYKRQRSHQRVGIRRLLVMARKHKGFAYFTTPSAFIGNFTMQSPIYILSLMGATEITGLFSRARQLLSMPITLLGGAIAKVFQRRAAVDLASAGNCRRVYIRTFLLLAGTGLVPIVLLTIWAPDIFEIFLGPNWRSAGEIARVLAPMLFFRFICSPLATVFYVVGAQREDALLTVLMTAVTFALIIIAYLVFSSPISIVIAYSIGELLLYCIYILRSYFYASSGVQVI